METGLLLLAKGNYNTAIQQEYNEQLEEECYLDINDLYGTEGYNSVDVFFEKNDSLKSMQQAYQILMEDTKLTYYEVASQPLLLVGKYTFSEDFVDGGKEAVNQNGKGRLVTSVKSRQLGESTAEYYHMSDKMESGTWFTKSDYIWKSEKTIPVILGYNYKKYMNIGDIFSFCYLGEEEQKGEVIGFLKQDASISYEGENVPLENEMLIPSMIVKEEKTDEIFLKRLYLIKTEGALLYHNPEEYEAATQLVKNIAEKTGIAYSYVEDLSIIPENEQYEMPVNTASLLLTGAKLFVILLGSVTLFVTFQIWKEQENKKVERKLLFCHVTAILAGMIVAFTISYKILLRLVGNETLRLNIMRGRMDVLMMIMIMCAIYIIGNFIIVIYLRTMQRKEMRKKGLV